MHGRWFNVKFSTPSRLLAAFSAAALLAVPAVSHAQLAPGEVVEVPAGETTSVDVGIPVQVSYNAGGWVVSSAGTTVTVTAPDSPGSTAAVPASAGGYSATVTLVATGEQAAPEPPAAPAAPAESAPPAARQDRAPAAGVDTADATVLRFNGQIDGNVIRVKVSLGQAAELMRFAGTDREGATLRYLDVNGRIIEGVTREVDPAARTMTLTYPEGQTPDNPFIMEVVRDGSAAEFIAVITSTNAPVASAGTDSPYAQFGALEPGADGESEQPDSPETEPESAAHTGLWAIAGVVALAVIGLLASRRRSK
ncbi:hypothetical protein SAMN04488535_0491 [Corynebacterium mycetoides]|uniref:Uncharacterized protein n=1 Tax=Corynebacterium mycetoides TaxID=38302 RepID=A0A1G9M9L7_9CORY|nr:hypothetical protein SAMN04488535_0491 [Corynebacterium mycetoides]